MIIYRELSSLEKDLAIPISTLYAVSNSLSRHYRTVKLPKKNGGTRTLHVPDELLKTIQRRIADTLLLHMPVSRYATAYRCGSSTVRGAQVHVGKAMVLKLDILHFFDSIRYSDVKDLVFPSRIYSEPIRILLAMLCYYKDGLPQGAPSSPAITNIIMKGFDDVVGKWCAEQNITYTRYCDDMTFSGDFDAAQVTAFVRTRLRAMGYLLNGQKTRLQRPGQQQSVTGIVVNEKPAVPAAYRHEVRQAVHYCRKFGVRSHLKTLGLEMTEIEYLKRLLGKVNYILQVMPENTEMQEYRNWILKAQKRHA